MVPSPKPINILEHEIIESLIEKDHVIIICTGGGGVPVYRDQNRLVGVEGVIDKDFASQKLAELIDADILLILTEVENVYINYNKPDQEALEKISTQLIKKYIQEGQFEPGSILPKIEAEWNSRNLNLGVWELSHLWTKGLKRCLEKLER